jgi:hypothetical protein
MIRTSSTNNYLRVYSGKEGIDQLYFFDRFDAYSAQIALSRAKAEAPRVYTLSMWRRCQHLPGIDIINRELGR